MTPFYSTHNLQKLFLYNHTFYRKMKSYLDFYHYALSSVAVATAFILRYRRTTKIEDGLISDYLFIHVSKKLSTILNPKYLPENLQFIMYIRENTICTVFLHFIGPTLFLDLFNTIFFINPDLL